jgi:hypothetical protein
MLVRFLSILLLLMLVSDCDAQLFRRRSSPSFDRSTVATPAAPYTGTAKECKDALGEVNAARAARGLKPFINDPLLNQAAQSAAKQRAAGLIHGHLSNDFACVPAGGHATAAGCGALEPSWGWGSCCTYDSYTSGGAAWVMGRDGNRYMHLFVR